MNRISNLTSNKTLKKAENKLIQRQNRQRKNKFQILFIMGENNQLVEQLNDILTRTELSRDSQLVVKLKGKSDALKQNFIANLPPNYRNEKEFVAFLERTESFERDLRKIKTEHQVVQMALENEGQLESEIEADFGSLIGKAMAAKRQLAYIRCLAQIQEIKLKF